jgi:hypothetical protein
MAMTAEAAMRRMVLTPDIVMSGFNALSVNQLHVSGARPRD